MSKVVPEIECGAYASDKWLTRYSRFKAPPGLGERRLVGKIYNPDGADLVGNRLQALVNGRIVVEAEARPDWTPFSVALPHSDEPVQIVLRTTKFRTPSLPDQRLLGILLDDFCLECEADEPYPEGPAQMRDDGSVSHLNNLAACKLDAVARLIDAGYISADGLALYPEETVDGFLFQSSAERRERFPFFDIEYYASRLDASLPAGANPLTHFLRYGVQYLIAPHPLIDPAFMARSRGDLFDSRMSISEFADLLIDDGCDPHPFVWLAWYREQARLHGGEPALLHYLRRGAAMDIPPNPYFEPALYRSLRHGPPDSGLPLVCDFLTVGDRAHIRCSDRFDPRWYAAHYPDVSASSLGPLLHFLTIGRALGYKPLSDAAPATARGKASPPTGDIVLPESRAAVARNYAEAGDAIRKALDSRRAKFVERDIRPVSTAGVEPDALELRFEDGGDVDVDILVPAYNEFEITLECLMALGCMKTELQFRVFLLDDASSDPRMARLAAISGLTVVRHERNLHFLRSCNRGFARTTAPFVMLLNNDTQVEDFALDRLVDAMSDDSVGAVAPMLLYPNARLQEAGCLLRSNGEGELIGVGEDPADPRYNYPRPIEYGSGACLLLRREALASELFDERFAPAYCEDADLCLRLRANGWRIMYEPRARVVHHLSVSTARESERRRVQLVRRNQQQLLEKWQDRLAEDNRVRVLAFYLPQFHPVAQNNLWWGRGFTDWTNTTRALPSFAGHYQPHLPADLGFYDLRLVETLDEQQKLARRYGVEGFVVYYYNFNGARVLEQPMETLLGRPHIDFRFALCWANENWTRHWDGGQRSALLTQQYCDETLDAVIGDFLRFGADPRAIRVSGKLLALVYRPLLIPDVAAFTARMRARFHEAGRGEIHLVYVESMEMLEQNVSPASIGFDASVEFPPQGIAEPYDRPVEIAKAGWQGKLYDYAATARNSVLRPRPGYTRYAGATPSWDNTPRQPLGATTLVGAQPEIFQAYLEHKIDETLSFNVGDERLLFINAWNEWAEGAHLEPDLGYGHRWLNAVRNALMAKGVYFDA